MAEAEAPAAASRRQHVQACGRNARRDPARRRQPQQLRRRRRWPPPRPPTGARRGEGSRERRGDASPLRLLRAPASSLAAAACSRSVALIFPLFGARPRAKASDRVVSAAVSLCADEWEGLCLVWIYSRCEPSSSGRVYGCLPSCFIMLRVSALFSAGSSST